MAHLVLMHFPLFDSNFKFCIVYEHFKKENKYLLTFYEKEVLMFFQDTSYCGIVAFLKTWPFSNRFESHLKKTNNVHMRKQRRRSACGNCEADQRLFFRYTDSTIPLLPKYEISFL